MKANYPVSIFAGRAVEDHLRPLTSLPESFDSKAAYKSEHIFAGGSAPNAAITHGILGRKAFHRDTAYLYTPIGHDNGAIREELDDNGVTLRDCSPGNDFFLQRNFCFVNDTVRFIAKDETPERNKYAEDIIAMPPVRQRRLSYDMEMADVVMLECRCPLITTAVGRAAKDNKITVVLDAGTWKPYVSTLIALSDIIIASQEFKPENQSMTPEQIIGYFISKGKENVAVTRGVDSTLLNTPNGIIKIPTPNFKSVDTSAAGDIMHGAFCFYFARSGDIAWSIEQANKVASESIRFLGPREGILRMTAEDIPTPSTSKVVVPASEYAI